MLERTNPPITKTEEDLNDWRSQPIFPIIRDATRDDFKARESSESNPKNYVVEIFPKPDIGRLKEHDIYINIMRGHTMAGLVDLRKNNEEKYTIWIGYNHNELMTKAAQLPDNPLIRQYMALCTVQGDEDGKNIHALQKYGQQSCDRTPEQIKKVLDAVDIAINKAFENSQDTKK